MKKQDREYEIKRELDFWQDVRTHLGHEEPLSRYENELLDELDEIRNEDQFGIPRY